MIDLLKSNSDNNYPKAIACSLGILIGFLVLSIFYIINTAEPPEEVGVGGIIVNYGTSDEGMGSDYMSIEEPSVDPNANLTAPDKIVPDANTAETPTTQNNANDIVTQDMEDAVAVKTKTNASSTAPSQNTDVKESKPTINQNALYKGKKNNGSGAGDGITGTPGNQGKPTGDPLANNYDGTGSGNGGVALDPKSRRWSVRPTIKDDGQENGRVVIKFRIDKSGNVILAQNDRGTTISNTALIEKCEQAVLASKLIPVENESSFQDYQVIFKFILK
ncbi:energy transducer TonB [Pedobacter puniceum]|uniref:Energy transducer TonB n=1 Tax=Pedobacter puniceum TaxID=2666136 RepID=A0A7K0FJ40_9SPHI|nr:energy transducer TonB [Pedobacter puniceum]MRX45943.1 energy transducer TonB [Pedobacter puniceum]